MVDQIALERIIHQLGFIVLTNSIKETEEQREKRQAAIWNGDCAFEAENEGDADWLKQVQDNYGLTRGLVDV